MENESRRLMSGEVISQSFYVTNSGISDLATGNLLDSPLRDTGVFGYLGPRAF